MIERQKIEPVGTRVVHLIFGVVVFIAEGARPLSEIHRETSAHRQHIRSIRLEDVAVNLRPRLVGRIPLQSLGSLPELQVEPHPETLAGGHIGRMLENDAGLVQAEHVAQYVVSPQQIHAPIGMIKVVGVVSIEGEVERVSLEKVERAPIRVC